jgi:hypothetical protein
MSKEIIAQFTREIRRDEGGASSSGRTFEYSPVLLACTSLFPVSGEEGRRERNATLDLFVPIVERLSRMYEIPPPTLAFLRPEERGRGLGCYEPRRHEIRLSPMLSPAVLVRTLFHECQHAYQASFVVAAVARDIEDGRASLETLRGFSPSLVEDVYQRQSYRDPTILGIGAILRESNAIVTAARECGAQTVDTDEYMQTQGVYRNSFEELCATIVELEVAVWQAEEALCATEELSERWKQHPHELGFLGDGVSSVMVRLATRRANVLRAHIRGLSEEIMSACQRVYGEIVRRNLPVEDCGSGAPSEM